MIKEDLAFAESNLPVKADARGRLDKGAAYALATRALLYAKDYEGVIAAANKVKELGYALEADYANYHLRFLLEFTGALGFRPSFEDIAPFAGEYLPQVKALLSASFSETMLLPLSGSVRSALCEVFLQYLSYHTDQTITIRSLPVLRELYGAE
jgi:hypothetical protein